MIIGMLFFFISMALVNLRTGKEKSSKKTAWLIAITVAFVGNGMCSTVQKMQQLKFSGGFKRIYAVILSVHHPYHCCGGLGTGETVGFFGG